MFEMIVKSLKEEGVLVTGSQEEAARGLVGKMLMAPVVVPLSASSLSPLVVRQEGGESLSSSLSLNSKKRVAEDVIGGPTQKKRAVGGSSKGQQCCARVVAQGSYEDTGVPGDPNIGTQCMKFCKEEGAAMCGLHMGGKSKYGDYAGGFSPEATQLAIRHMLPKMGSEEGKEALLAKCDGPTKEKMLAAEAAKKEKKAAAAAKGKPAAVKKVAASSSSAVAVVAKKAAASDEDGSDFEEAPLKVLAPKRSIKIAAATEEDSDFEEEVVVAKAKSSAPKRSIKIAEEEGSEDGEDDEDDDGDLLSAGSWKPAVPLVVPLVVSSSSRPQVRVRTPAMSMSRSPSPGFLEMPLRAEPESEEEDFTLAVDPGRPAALPLAAMREEEKKIISITGIKYYADGRVPMYDKGVPLHMFDLETGAYAGTFDRSKRVWTVKA
jgi:hypothetical protein